MDKVKLIANLIFKIADLEAKNKALIEILQEKGIATIGEIEAKTDELVKSDVLEEDELYNIDLDELIKIVNE